MAIEPKTQPLESADVDKDRKGGTLRPIELDLQKYRNLNFVDFVDHMFRDLQALKDRRFNYYDGLREKSRANELRAWLVRLAAIAAVLTAIATVVRIVFAGDQTPPTYDIWLFASALLAYGVMGALGLIESSSDATSSYFRHLGVAMAIRDLWTKLEFAFLKESLTVEAGDAAEESAARNRIIALAEAFCGDLGKLVSGELGEWRAEFIASISELDVIAREGSDSAKSQLETAISDYRAAITKMEEAEKAAKEASNPALLNVTIEGEFDDTVTVSVDNVEMITTTKRSFAIERLIPGDAKVEAAAKKDGQLVSCGKWVVLQSGIQSLALPLK